MQPADSRAVQPIDFEDALRRTEGRPRHLLVGNGFSIDARPRQFNYSSLYSKAGKFSRTVEDLFEANGHDFEAVLEALHARQAQEIGLYEWGLHNCYISEVHRGFMLAMSRVHPDNSHSLTVDEFAKCADFLSPFVGKNLPLRVRGKIFTTNYDMLLYWTIVRSGKKLYCHDAHVRPHPDANYRVWIPDKYPQILYLHGALHLYEHQGKQYMLCWDGEKSLIERTRFYLKQHRFPLIVAEGTREQKMARIARSPYLKAARRSFDSALKDATASLFTVGHGLGDRDAHLLLRIGSLRIGSVFVGAYGGLDSADGRAAQKWASRWWAARDCAPRDYPLEVFVFDTKKVSAWRDMSTQASIQHRLEL